jgi:hypothetical protein
VTTLPPTTDDMARRIKSLGEPRNEAEGLLITEAQRQLWLSDEYVCAVRPGMSLAARAVYDGMISEANRTAAALLYAVRVLRGVD